MKKENIQQPQRIRRCPECGSNRLMRDYKCAEIVCMGCGFVVATKIADQGPEWRAFDDEQRAKRSRAGAPITFTIHDKGLSTMIDWHDRDVYGKRIQIFFHQVRRESLYPWPGLPGRNYPEPPGRPRWLSQPVGDFFLKTFLISEATPWLSLAPSQRLILNL